MTSGMRSEILVSSQSGRVSGNRLQHNNGLCQVPGGFCIHEQGDPQPSPEVFHRANSALAETYVAGPNVGQGSWSH